MKVLYVFLGGGIGSVLRYLISVFFIRFNGNGFPVATLTINLTGCFIIGILAATTLKMRWNEALTLLVFTGILGGFTTFSAFALEFTQLIKNNQTGMALLYVLLSNFAGLTLCALGFFLFK